MATIAAFSCSSLPLINVEKMIIAHLMISLISIKESLSQTYISSLQSFRLGPVVYIFIYFCCFPLDLWNFGFKSGVRGNFPECLCFHILSIVVLVCIPLSVLFSLYSSVFSLGKLELPSSSHPDNCFYDRPDCWGQQWKGELTTECGFSSTSRARASRAGKDSFHIYTLVSSKDIIMLLQNQQFSQ